MLAASPQLYYVHEPFNPDVRQPGICNITFPHHFTYITEANERKYYTPISHMLARKFDLTAAIAASRSLRELRRAVTRFQEFREYRRQSKWPLIKDPIALLSAGWLARRFDINVVLTIRHPAAFVASMKRLNWGFEPSRWALSQELLLRDHLKPFEPELRLLQDSPGDAVQQAAVLWKVLYSVVDTYQTQFPHWTYLRHEDLSRDPMAGFERLYAALALHFSDRSRTIIAEYSDAANPAAAGGTDRLIKMNSRTVISQWRHSLSQQEVQRIREIVYPVSSRFYSEDEWEIP